MTRSSRRAPGSWRRRKTRKRCPRSTSSSDSRSPTTERAIRGPSRECRQLPPNRSPSRTCSSRRRGPDRGACTCARGASPHRAGTRALDGALPVRETGAAKLRQARARLEGPVSCRRLARRGGRAGGGGRRGGGGGGRPAHSRGGGLGSLRRLRVLLMGAGFKPASGDRKGRRREQQSRHPTDSHTNRYFHDRLPVLDPVKSREGETGQILSF